MYTKARIKTATEHIDTYDIDEPNFMSALRAANKIVDAIIRRKGGVYRAHLVEVK